MTPETRPETGSESPVERARARLSEARERLADAERALGEVQAEGVAREEQPAPSTVESSWRVQLWTAPSECRLGIEEVTEAIGKSASWIYQRTRSDAETPIPHAKIAGALSFKAGELRNWIRRTENVEVAGPSDPPEDTVRLHERRAS